MAVTTIFLTGVLLLTLLLVPILLWILHDKLSATALTGRIPALQPVESLISDRYRELVLLAAGGGAAGSLILSYGVGLDPCPLCWWQRVFLYPIAILTGTALVIEDTHVRDYVTPLALIGGTISLYHYLVQHLPQLEATGCGTGIACSTIQLSGYGFITIPWMSLTTFILVLILAGWFGRRES